LLFGDQNIHGLARKRQRARQCFVQHYTDRIPITSKRYGLAGGLFRRHILERAAHVRISALVSFALAQIRGQAEVQQNQTLVTRYQNVRGFDITMQHSS
jgi:hypothetical protein